MATHLFALGLWSLVFPCVFNLFLTAGIAFGSLYPTKPMSTTIFAAGRPAQVKWVEDGHRPLLGDLGHIKIHLLAGNKTYLSTIAENVNPLSLSITVYIPQVIPSNYHVYTLRFVPSHSPHRPIYSAPFTILPNPFSRLLTPSHSANPAPTSPLTAQSSEVIRNPGMTATSTVTGTRGAMPSPSGKYLPTQPDSGASRFELRTRWRLGRSFRDPPFRRTAVRSRTWNLDMEGMKFKLVFFVWPALIGFSLSV